MFLDLLCSSNAVSPCGQVRDYVSSMRLEAMALIPALSIEGYAQAYPHVARLSMLQELEGVAHALQQAGTHGVPPGKLLSLSGISSSTNTLGGGAGMSAQSVLKQQLKWLKWEERLVTTQVSWCA